MYVDDKPLQNNRMSSAQSHNSGFVGRPMASSQVHREKTTAVIIVVLFDITVVIVFIAVVILLLIAVVILVLLLAVAEHHSGTSLSLLSTFFTVSIPRSSSLESTTLSVSDGGCGARRRSWLVLRRLLAHCSGSLRCSGRSSLDEDGGEGVCSALCCCCCCLTIVP